MAWKPIPINPPLGSLSNCGERVVAAAKIWFVAVMPAMLTVSLKAGPETEDPSPYVSSREVLGKAIEVEDWMLLYFVCDEVELEEGIQRSPDLRNVSDGSVGEREWRWTYPVSKSM